MSTNIAQIMALVNEIAPFELAEPWDNVGLLAGSLSSQVVRVLCALDLTPEVICEARETGAQLIITHHPVMFRGRKNASEEDQEGSMLAELIRARIGLIAAHTNYDNAKTGVGMALCNEIGITDAQVLENGVCIGNVEVQSLGTLASNVSGKLGGAVRRYGHANMQVSRVAVLGGSGGDYANIASAAGAQVFITGEISYHDALDSLAVGLCCIEAGHAATELPGIKALACGLQKAANALQYRIEVTQSAVESFL